MKVSVIGGAGRLGSCAVFALAILKLAEEIVVIDVIQNLLLGQVLDLDLSMVGHSVEVRAGNYEDMAGSDVVIMTATPFPQPAATRLEDLKRNIPVVCDVSSKISKFCPEAIVIMVTNPIDSLNYATFLNSHFDRKKVIGYNLNDSLRFRMSIAKSLVIKSTEVEGLAIGEHGGTLALLFSSMRVGGKAVPVSEELKQLVRLETPNILKTHSGYKLGRPMAFASAAGLAEMVRSIKENSKLITSCSVVLEGEYGYNGVHQILEWKLPPDEREELEKAAASLKTNAKIVRQEIEAQCG
jgi:malate dehydrogenase